MKSTENRFASWSLQSCGLALFAGFLVLASAQTATADDIITDPSATKVEHDESVFRSGPTYEDAGYDTEAQLEIYGGKSAFPTPRPIIELGREMYTSGPLSEGGTGLGKLNPTYDQFLVYGDWRAALAYNDNGAAEVGQVATRLNLDFDYRFTSTERVHAIIGPLDGQGEFTRCEFFGDDAPNNDPNRECDLQADLNLDALFLEGDGGAIYSGLAGQYSSIDFPFSIGLMPLLFQNGVWLDDAFTGAAFAIPALNSPPLDISNMDFTFFAGFDKVTNPGIVDNDGVVADHNVNIYGAATYIETRESYTEAGFAHLDGESGLDDQSFSSLTFAFTKRYLPRISNSSRVIWSFGQDPDNNNQQTADGVIFLIENSLITSKPSTQVPYLNLFAGLDRPQSAARAGGAGGILKNTGINFETDGLTGFPKLDDTGQNTFGGALGMEYLFALNRQLVVEAAALQVIDGENENGRAARGDEYALGLRYQFPLSEAWIFRSDAMHGWRMEDENLAGLRFEIRRKF
ncbi:MAG: hypothetical protein CMM54_08235 [Rhodospirillaceae bacterium]|nr:hypothetical protein [Rhodospirillaceae bacterium]